tara:strand:+ start:158 stop:1315 length:1158 start_codon:yes stop_codon:yes gene_type:complete
MNDMLINYRDKFDLNDDISYLNSAYMGLLPIQSVKAGYKGIDLKAKAWNIHTEDFYNPPERVRALAADLLSCSDNDIFFMPSSSYGLATFANNFKLNNKKTILLLEEEFPSNVYIWKDLALRQNAKIKYVKRPKNNNWTDEIINNIDINTGLISVPQTHWVDGAFIDLEKISDYIKNTDIALAVDATQSAGILKLQIDKIKPDILVISSYKWLLGPYSLGFAYIDKKYQINSKPLEFNWMSMYQKPTDGMFPDLLDYENDLIDTARRFDFGHRGNVHLMPILESSLKFLKNIKRKNILNHIEAINKIIINNLSDLNVSFIEEKYRSPHYLGILLENKISDNFIEILSKNNVFISNRGKFSLRVSPHLWNNENDVDKFLEAIKNII